MTSAMAAHEVLKDNFANVLPAIKKNIDRAAFIGKLIYSS